MRSVPLTRDTMSKESADRNHIGDEETQLGTLLPLQAKEVATAMENKGDKYYPGEE